MDARVISAGSVNPVLALPSLSQAMNCSSSPKERGVAGASVREGGTGRGFMVRAGELVKQLSMRASKSSSSDAEDPVSFSISFGSREGVDELSASMTTDTVQVRQDLRHYLSLDRS